MVQRTLLSVKFPGVKFRDVHVSSKQIYVLCSQSLNLNETFLILKVTLLLAMVLSQTIS